MDIIHASGTPTDLGLKLGLVQIQDFNLIPLRVTLGAYQGEYYVKVLQPVSARFAPKTSAALDCMLEFEKVGDARKAFRTLNALARALNACRPPSVIGMDAYSLRVLTYAAAAIDADIKNASIIRRFSATDHVMSLAGELRRRVPALG